jgi:hypothetical protein
VPDVDPNQAVIGARASLRDTAKWIVTIVGATIVLVVGGGLIAKIADLDWVPRLWAAGSLVVLTMVCLVPLRAAIDIVAAKLATFEQIARSREYDQTRRIVDGWLRGQYPPEIAIVERLYQQYQQQTEIANDARRTAGERDAANEELDELQPRVREILELSNTEFLRLKFETLVRSTTIVLPVIGVALFIFFDLHASRRSNGEAAFQTGSVANCLGRRR